MAGHDQPAAELSGPDPDGFHQWRATGNHYAASYGTILVRPEGEHVARLRIATGPERANPFGPLHGGFLLSFLDQVLFVGPVGLGRITLGAAVTLTVSTQFLAPGSADDDLDAVVEIVQETGRLLFLRGQLEQRGQAILTFQATLRKLAPPAR